MHDRCAAIVRHAVLSHRVENQLRVDLAQAHIGACIGGHGPREAPAVAVEHRQRPQVHGMLRHAPGHDVANRIQIGAPVMVDHALGVAGGARGVVERNGVPFIGGRLPCIFRIAPCDEALILRLADALASARVFGIVHVDHQRFRLEGRERAPDGAREFAVGDQDLGLAVLEHEGDRLRVEARVQRVEDRARHGYAEMALEHFRGIREHRSDRVADADSPTRERGSEPPAARIGLGPRGAARSVNDREMSGIDVGGALDESQRRQGRVVGRVLVETALVRIRLVCT